MTENPIARHYSRFRVGERLLLTGHSHQAWPDVGFDGQQRAWLDAAEFVDDKWEKAAVQAGRVRDGFARLLGDTASNVALGQNTHELVTRWLSALPLANRPRIVTTDGEFHTIHRQVDRLAEAGFDVAKVSARPVDTLAERLAASIDSRTSAVMVSSVLFETAEIVPGLDRVAAACHRHGASLLVDAYHHLNVIPFDLRAIGLEDAFVTGGGYKYCQLGEGNCFLRVPGDSRLRPVLTGWFAAFEAIEDRSEGVEYGRGAAAFAGATYDPTSQYRAAAVFAFHREQDLTAHALRAINARQVDLLKSGFEALDVSPEIARVEPMPVERRGGFLAIRSADARRLSHALRARGVYTDARGDILRVGPAPYLRDDQLRDAIVALGEVVRAR
ncbi:MAG TPA: aminotransferase class V-fold PLP-dependent enzyme [Vicinamibacterales bacterium]